MCIYIYTYREIYMYTYLDNIAKRTAGRFPFSETHAPVSAGRALAKGMHSKGLTNPCATRQ